MKEKVQPSLVNDKEYAFVGVDMGAGRDVTVRVFRFRNGSRIALPAGLPVPPNGLRIGGLEVSVEEMEECLAADAFVKANPVSLNTHQFPPLFNEWWKPKEK